MKKTKGTLVEIRIAVDGTAADVESLWDWLRQEREFRGYLRLDSAQASDGAMGAATELIVQVTALAGAGALTALTRTLTVWLTQRRTDVSIKVTGPDGRHVEVSVKRAPDAERLLRTVLEPQSAQADTGAG